jgi:cytochrome c
MRAKTSLAGFFVVVGWVAIASLALAQQSPPESEKAKRIEALVKKAAALVESKGKAAVPELKKSGSEWLSGDTYLFVSDMQGIVLFNGGFPEFEGTDRSGVKDSNGKVLHGALLQAAQPNGSGWVDYVFPKPGHTEPAKNGAT